MNFAAMACLATASKVCIAGNYPAAAGPVDFQPLLVHLLGKLGKDGLQV